MIYILGIISGILLAILFTLVQILLSSKGVNVFKQAERAFKQKPGFVEPYKDPLEGMQDLLNYEEDQEV